jgi:protein gp37
MAENTAIAWTDHTFNIAWGCVKVSPGCKNCYAETHSKRFGGDVWGPGKPRRTFGDKHWAEPLKWNRRAERTGVRERVFTSSMCDVFEAHPDIDSARNRLWNLIYDTPHLDWQILTKRPENIIIPEGPWPNVWMGVSVESDEYGWRVDKLRETTGGDDWGVVPILFISYEPALGPLRTVNLDGIDWVIYGGESGPGFRKDDPAWAFEIGMRCKDEGIAFFYKQDAALKPGYTRAAVVRRQWPEGRGA